MCYVKKVFLKVVCLQNCQHLMNGIAANMDNLLLLENVVQWTRADCGRKIHWGRPAMFLSLALVNTCSTGGMFYILDA